MSNKPIIAIDGPAASGKGTLARRIAETLGFAHLDTGALYRAVGHEVLIAAGDPMNKEDALRGAYSLRQKIQNAASPDLILQRKELREDFIGNAASKVATITAVREALIDLQQNFAQDPPNNAKGAVLDGRDIGTVICPEAPVKLFITAPVEIRAERRLKELQTLGKPATYEAVLKDMQARDARDQGRKTAPMRSADDAVIIDTAHLDKDQAFDRAMQVIRARIPL